MTTIALQAAGIPDWLERINRAVDAITESAKSVQAAVVRERATVRFYLAARTLNGHINELLAALDQTTRDLQDGKLFERLDQPTQIRIRKKFAAIAVDPFDVRHSKPLMGNDKRSARVGAYRILFLVKGTVLVVTDIDARGDVYKSL